MRETVDFSWDSARRTIFIIITGKPIFMSWDKYMKQSRTIPLQNSPTKMRWEIIWKTILYFKQTSVVRWVVRPTLFVIRQTAVTSCSSHFTLQRNATLLFKMMTQWEIVVWFFSKNRAFIHNLRRYYHTLEGIQLEGRLFHFFFKQCPISKDQFQQKVRKLRKD